MPPSLAALRAAPHDAELLAVYADWLQTQGHPRGELIAVQRLAETTTSDADYVDARAQARALVLTHEELQPPTPGDDDDPERGRGVWATWSGGFVRELELLVDDPSPGAGRPEFTDGPTGWAELLAAIMAHPSLALVERVLLRFDLRGEPLDELTIALDVAIRGLARWRENASPGQSVQVVLWTQRLPAYRAREHLRDALPELRPCWYSTDITVIPPPPDSPAFALERELCGVNRFGDPQTFDLLWFDARGHFLARLEARSLSFDGIADEGAWQVHARHLAETRPQPVFDADDPLPRRRIARLLDGVAARLPSHASPPAPRAAPRIEAIELPRALGRLGEPFAMLSVAAAGSLQRFTALDWWWVDEGEWRALVGLGDDQVLVLGVESQRRRHRGAG
jgi:uncharacterized protein (TIGR02996 family)